MNNIRILTQKLMFLKKNFDAFMLKKDNKDIELNNKKITNIKILLFNLYDHIVI